MGKKKVNITVDPKLWKEFAKRCRRVGLNASRVIAVFVTSMASDEPLERMEKFVHTTRVIKKNLLNL